MSLVAFVATALLGAAVAAVTGRWPGIRAAVALLALVGCAVLARGIGKHEIVPIGDSAFVTSGYLRLWLSMASGSLFLAVVLLVALRRTEALAAPLTVLGVAAGALALPEAPGAVLLLGAGYALIGFASTSGHVAAPRVPGLAVEAFRVNAIVVVLALVGLAWAASPGVGLQPTTVLAAYILLGGALALRLGVVPLHLPAIRSAEASPLAVGPLLLAWLPAAFAIVVLSWYETTLVPQAPDLSWARVIVVTVGLATLIATSLAIVLQRDLGRLAGYSAIQGAAFAMLALAAADAAAGPLIRIWLLLWPLSVTALMAGQLALETVFQARRVSDLQGWLRRTPTIGLALLLALIATYGLPGFLVFQARSRILELAGGPTVGALGIVAAALGLLGWVRTAWLGLQLPGPIVDAGPSERPIRPTSRDLIGAPAWAPRLRLAASWVAEAGQLNRVPLAAAAVLLLALLPVLLGAGVGSLGAAAAEPLPSTIPGPGSSPSPGASPTPSPTGTSSSAPRAECRACSTGYPSSAASTHRSRSRS